MNRSVLSIGLAITLAFFASGARLNSQESAVGSSPRQLLAALKASNTELLQKQEKTLQKLDELKKQAEQLRILSKRS